MLCITDFSGHGRGRIGIFNRSYYEETLVVRVHPEYLGGQKSPYQIDLDQLWQERGENHVWLEERRYPYYQPIESDPRWALFLEKVGVSDEDLAAIEFEFTLPSK